MRFLMAGFLLVSISGCVENEPEPGVASQTQAVGCTGLQHALENCPNATACQVIEDLLARQGCVAALACPCFDLAMLQALGTATVWGQQRFVNPDGSGLNWVGMLVGGTGYGQVHWDPAGTSTDHTNRCWYNDPTYANPVDISYESALICDALLNEHSLAVGARCSSDFCP
jgi:hypothetical protein